MVLREAVPSDAVGFESMEVAIDYVKDIPGPGPPFGICCYMLSHIRAHPWPP